MTFKTKYNNDETVWFIKSGELIEGTVLMVKAYQYGEQRTDRDIVHKEYTIRFLNKSTITLPEKDIYKTKEEAANAWLLSQGLSVGIKD